MKRSVHVLLLTIVLSALVRGGALADPYPLDPPIETERSTALRAVYFPFLAVGHGVVLIGKYLIAYPLYYAVKPVYDLVYESSEDPEAMERATSGSGS